MGRFTTDRETWEYEDGQAYIEAEIGDLCLLERAVKGSQATALYSGKVDRVYSLCLVVGVHDNGNVSSVEDCRERTHTIPVDTELNVYIIPHEVLAKPQDEILAQYTWHRGGRPFPSKGAAKQFIKRYMRHDMLSESERTDNNLEDEPRRKEQEKSQLPDVRTDRDDMPDPRSDAPSETPRRPR